MMVLDLFKRSTRSPAKALFRKQADTLLAQTMRAARDPGLFGPGRIPDDFQGRFDAVSLVASLVSMQLSALGGDAAALNQAFVNALFKSFDDALREDGVGDLTVPKKMQLLAESFYGRAAAYRTAFEQINSDGAEGMTLLTDAVHRNTLRSQEDSRGFAAALAGHSLQLRAALAQSTLDDLCGGAIEWPAFAAP
jgi:cytochrome b pre-mRNA-processing protein 3